MQLPRPDCPHSPVKVFTKPFLPGGQREYSGENDAGGDGCTFEIGNFIGSSRECLRRDIKARQPANTATYEVNQRYPIPTCLQTGGKTKSRGSNAERENIRKGIEFSAEGRMLMPPASYASVKHIKYESARHHSRRAEKMSDRPAFDVEHCKKYGGYAAGRIPEREEICELKAAYHGKMPDALRGRRRLECISTRLGFHIFIRAVYSFFHCSQRM